MGLREKKDRLSTHKSHFVIARKTEDVMFQRTLIALGAVTVAGIAVLGFGRQLDKWRRANLDFEYPIEELFV